MEAPRSRESNYGAASSNTLSANSGDSEAPELPSCPSNAHAALQNVTHANLNDHVWTCTSSVLSLSGLALLPCWEL